MENIYLKINRFLQAGQRTVLARIVRRSGSSPRRTGTQCLITEGGDIIGTVGGGLLESGVINRAKEMFGENRSTLLSFKMTGKVVAEAEMLCGGSVDVYLEPIFPDNEVALAIFKTVAEMIDRGDNGILVTRVSEGIGPADAGCRMLIGPHGKITGDLIGVPSEWKKQLSRRGGARRVELLEAEKDGEVYLIEPIQPDDALYIFGAGHVSRPVAVLAEMVGFSVTVIDDREEFANRKRFPRADKILVAPFLKAFDQIDINASSYIVIVTRGHAHDRDVLLRALDYPAAYIGMIGSRRKIEIIYRSLMEAGISSGQLEQVHSPIGLSIGAQTPEEIAVSIVAELIEVRASQRQGGRAKLGQART